MSVKNVSDISLPEINEEPVLATSIPVAAALQDTDSPSVATSSLANNTQSQSTSKQSSNRPYKLLRRTSTIVTDGGDENDYINTSDARKRLVRFADSIQTQSIPEFTPSPGVSEENIQPDNDPNETGRPRWLSRTTKDPVQAVKKFFDNPKVQNVLKCALAYFVSSLVVYTPIGKLYGVSDTKHMVATVATYFNPARTSGSMVEATIFVAFALLYSFVLSVLSMLVSAIFYDLDMRATGYVIDIIVFCGGGIGTIIYLKQRVNRATFGTATTVACISLIIILTREGNVQAGLLSVSKLFQNFALCASGILVSMAFCYLLWPQSAILELKRALNKSLTVDAKMLDYITERFLNGETIDTARFKELNNETNASFKALEKHIIDAKFELRVNGREKEFKFLNKMVTSSHRLTSHISGLASSARIQWHLQFQGSEPSSPNDDRNSVLSFDNITSRVSRETLRPSVGELEASTSNELFHLFVHYVGPPLRAFSYTMREILDGIPFKSEGDFPINFDRKSITDLKQAISHYSTVRAQSISELYSQRVFKSDRDFEDIADEEGVAASCGNFSYVLEAFGAELQRFLGIVHEYDEMLRLNSGKSYEWLRFWSHKGYILVDGIEDDDDDEEQDRTLQMYKRSFYEQQHSEHGGLGYKVWKSFRMFRRTDVQFGIKVGIGAAIFAIPAFMDDLRPIFGKWRGEWGLITYSIIMAKSIGGTLKTVRTRIGGTCVGALVAYLTWTAFPENPYALSLMGFLIALPCFWIILYWESNNPFGRFILLTYNISALYSYSISSLDNEDDDDEGGSNPIIGDIAFHRLLSVSIGTLWALCITVLFWPNSARRQFKRVLAVQWLRMGLVWKSDPLKSEHQGVRGIPGENELQGTMIELQDLLNQATEEVRLKGPYPVNEYKAVLTSTQTILDMYRNMSVLAERHDEPTARQREIVEYTTAERKEICSRLFLFFYLVSSALKMGFPLPDKLPSTEHAIDRMLAKLNEFRQKSIDDEAADEEHFVFFYSYVLATITIAEELAKIAIHIQNLFGVIEDEMLETM